MYLEQWIRCPCSSCLEKPCIPHPDHPNGHALSLSSWPHHSESFRDFQLTPLALHTRPLLIGYSPFSQLYFQLPLLSRLELCLSPLLPFLTLFPLPGTLCPLPGTLTLKEGYNPNITLPDHTWSLAKQRQILSPPCSQNT